MPWAGRLANRTWASDIFGSLGSFCKALFEQTLKLAQLEGTYPKLVKSLHHADLLILDDWLRDLLTLVDAQFLLDILDDRYGRMATMLVSQFPIPTWHARIPDPTLADVILDRLVHNAHHIELQGESQRKIRAQRTMAST